MSGYSKFVVLALLMVTASAVIDAKVRGTTIKEQVNEEMLEAEIKVLASFGEAERALASRIVNQQVMMATPTPYDGRISRICRRSGQACSPSLPPEQCCSGACVPHPMFRITVCA